LHASLLMSRDGPFIRNLNVWESDDEQLLEVLAIVRMVPLILHDLCASRPVVGRSPEQAVKLLGLLLSWSTGQHMAGRNGLGWP
jgi:hypothetical protein